MTTHPICKLDDIIPEGGVCALIEGKQIAIFRTKNDELFAIDNLDPFSKANVLSRGLIGGTVIKSDSEDDTLNGSDVNSDASIADTTQKEVIYVASPIYKQRFDLATGQCLDDETVKLNSYEVALEGDQVVIKLADNVAA